MRLRSAVPGLLPLFLCAQAPTPPFRTLPPSKAGEPVRFTFQAPPGATWATVFFRAAGEEEFRSLSLRGEGGNRQAELPSSEIGGRSLQYYLAFKVPEGVKYLPEGAPDALGRLELPALPAAAGAEGRLTQRFPIHVEGSLEQVVYRSRKVDGERTLMDSGQVALGYELESGEHHMTFNTRLAYQGQPEAGRPSWSVGEFRGVYAYRDQRARIGDMSFMESEFTVGGMGRRGMDYQYDDRTFYAHLFAVNTEQLEGFRGLAWPGRDTGLFGGAVGYAFWEGALKSKLVFLTGRDDPSQGVNLGFAPSVTRREGSTGGLTLEADLAEHRLSLNGEYARASYDKDLDDTFGKVQDQAWRLGGAWNDSLCSARFSYRQIGKDFGTLGYAMMEGDRRGVDGGVSLNLGTTLALNASVSSELNNPSADPLETRARNDSQNLEAQWTPVGGITLRGGLSRGSQEAGTAQGALVPFANSRRTGTVAGLDWALGPKGALTFSAQFDHLESTGGTSTTGRSTTLVLGGSFQEPDLLRLAPSFSLSRSSGDGVDQESKVFSAFLNAQVTLVRRWLTLSMNGGYNRTEAPGIPAVTATNADAALQYALTPYLEKLPRHCQATLALRFRYTRVQSLPEADRRASLALNFSF